MTPNATTRVIGCIRVSTVDQAEEGVSLDAQAEKVRGFAALHDLDLIGVEADAGISAKTLDRPGLARVLAALDSGEAAGLVIPKLDRLSRSLADWNHLIDAYFGPAAGRQLFSVADSVNTTGRMVLNMMMTIYQWERETIVERTREAMAHKWNKGEAAGHVPYGYRLAPDGRSLVPVPAELAALDDIRRWHAEGRTLRSIASELDSQRGADQARRPVVPRRRLPAPQDTRPEDRLVSEPTTDIPPGRKRPAIEGPKTLSHQLREIIARQDGTPTQLAREADINLKVLTRFLDGARGLSLATADRIAIVLKLKLDDRGAWKPKPTRPKRGRPPGRLRKDASGATTGE